MKTTIVSFYQTGITQGTGIGFSDYTLIDTNANLSNVNLNS